MSLKEMMEKVWQQPGCLCPNHLVSWYIAFKRGTHSATRYYKEFCGIFWRKGTKWRK